jgi:hypothetical protein
MSLNYGPRDPLRGGITTDGLIFYIHPQLKQCWNGSDNYMLDLISNNVCTVTDVTADTNGNFIFNGTTSIIDTNNTYIDNGTPYTLSSSTSDYTLEAWIYVETSQGSTTDADSIIGSTGSVGVGMQVGISGSSPRINFGARSTSNFYGSTFSYNQWYHVVWSHDYGNISTVYMNGVQDLTSSGGSYNIISGTYGNITIGNSSNRVTGFYDGKMGPIRMYNRAITQTEVTQNFNSSKAKYGL